MSAGGVGAEAKPSAVAERDQAGITDEQVETHAGDGEDDDVGGRGEGQAEPEQHRRHQHKPKGDDQQRQVTALVHGSGLQPLEALAQEAARPDQKDEEHQEVHRGRSAMGGKNWTVRPRHHADDDRGQHHAPEAAEPADDDDHEGGGDDLAAHRRVNAADGGQRDASKRREPDADRNHRRHHGSQRDTERAHHVRVLHAGAHDPAEGGLVEEEPQADDGKHGDAENARR